MLTPSLSAYRVSGATARPPYRAAQLRQRERLSAVSKTREEEFVLAIRRKFQKTMRNDLIAAVEQLGGRKVIAFMSDNHMEPDFSVEVFVLEPLAASPV